MNKKIFLMVFCMILLAGTVSAFEFDNVKSYDPETKTITITNLFGAGSDIADIRLITPTKNYVPVGYQEVARFEVTSYKDYDNAFKELELFDKKKGMNKFVRNFDYKSQYFEEVEVDDYGRVCDIIQVTNGSVNSNCRIELVGSHIELQGRWKKLTPATFKKNDVAIIGIFTDVERGDNVEWIPNMFGVRIDEWATWKESSNAGLRSYFALNLTSGAVVDSTVTINATNVGAARGVPGRVGNSFDFNGAGNQVTGDSNIGITGSMNRTICGWIEPDSIGNNDCMWEIGENGALNRYSLTFSGGALRLERDGGGFTSTIKPLINVFSYVCVRLNGTDASDTTIFLYNESHNFSAVSTDAGAIATTNSPIRIGSGVNAGYDFDGVIDEVGFWNRSLSEEEMYYNFINNASWQGEFPPSVILSQPVEDANLTVNLIEFSGVVSTSGTIANVSLIVNETYNQTNSSGLTGDYNFTTTLSDGFYNWTYEACDIDNSCVNVTPQNFRVDTTSPVINITLPLDSFNILATGDSIELNWTSIEIHPDECWYEYNGVNTSKTCGDNATITYVADQNSVNVWGNDTFGNLGFDTQQWVVVILENQANFNNTSFETKAETFFLNFTSNGTVPTEGKLIYNGTSNTATIINTVGNNYNISTTIDIPLIDSNKTFFFNFTIGSTEISSSERIQNITSTFFTLCNTTITIPFINFTFKEESLAQPAINATFNSQWTYYLGSGSVTKALTFSNSSVNYNYTFCMTPSIERVNVDMSATYTNPESQQRSTTLLTVLTNATSTVVLYLLPTGDGISTPFVTIDSVGNALQDVTGTITRVLGGSTVTIDSRNTDASGLVLYFLDPDESYKASFVKTGFITQSFSFTPDINTRFVTLLSITETPVNGTQIPLNGTTYTILPSNSTLSQNSNVSFNFTVVSNGTITLISMNITNQDGKVLISEINAGTGSLGDRINVSNNTKLIGLYILQTGDETQQIMRTWIVGNEFVGDYSLFRQMSLYMEYDFPAIWRILLVLAVIWLTIIFMSKKEIVDSSESKIMVALLLIWGFSLVGWLDTGLVVIAGSNAVNGLAQFGNQFGIAILSSIIGGFLIFREVFAT